MADWLRPVFTRTRTPTEEQVNETEEKTSRLRPTSRVSSHMSLHLSTPPENVYQKPATNQMAEMLKVVMMNQGSLNPVPVQYNSCILHVLEAYQELEAQIHAKTLAIGHLKQSHAKDVMHYKALAGQWEQREKDYQTELKKLEVMLSRTEGVMTEEFTMARSSSNIHGSRRVADCVKDGLRGIKTRDVGHKKTSTGEISRPLYKFV